MLCSEVQKKAIFYRKFAATMLGEASNRLSIKSGELSLSEMTDCDSIVDGHNYQIVNSINLLNIPCVIGSIQQ